MDHRHRHRPALLPEVVEQVLAHFWLILFGALFTTLSSVAAVAAAAHRGRPGHRLLQHARRLREMVNLGLRNGASPAAWRPGRACAWWPWCSASRRCSLLLGEGPALHPAAPVDWAWLALLVPAGGLLALLWQRLHQPNPWLFGPLLVSAGASILYDLHLGLPPGASQVGQLLIGSGLGCHFDRAFFSRAPASSPAPWRAPH